MSGAACTRLLAIRSAKLAIRIVRSNNEPLAGGPSQAAGPIPTTFWWSHAPASPSVSPSPASASASASAMVSYHPSLLRPSFLIAQASGIGRCPTLHAFLSTPVVSAVPLCLRPLRAAAGGAASPVTSKPWPPLASSYMLLATPRGMLLSSCKCLFSRLLRRSVAMEANALFRRLPRCLTSRVATSSRLVSYQSLSWLFM